MALRKSFCARARTADRASSKALAFAVVMLVGLVLPGSTSAWAQVPCTLSFPNFRPDFTNNQNCLALNNYAAFGAPAASMVQPEGTPNPAQPAPQGVSTVLRLTPNTNFVSGSAWFKTPIAVAGGFSSTFTFQLSGSTSGIGDGIAFLIQNSEAGTSAIDASNGKDGCSIGFGETTVVNATCTGSTGGIPNSLAIEFDTFQNTDIGDVSANHVAIQSCGTGANSVDAKCRRADFDLTPLEISLADGHVHTATITFTPPSPNAVCEGPCPGTLDVIVDGHDLFPEVGVPFNMTSIGLGGGGTALVGFTAATGGADDNQDILSFALTPYSTQTITQPAPANQFTTFNFGSYLYKVKPNKNINALSVTEVPVNPVVVPGDVSPVFDPGPNFPGATCITYDSTGGKCIEFHAVCTPPVPDDNSCTSVSYDVVTSYDVPAGTGNIQNPGFLKATGQACPPAVPFDSNIITQFFQTRIDPTTKGSSKPSFSCFVAVQNVKYSPADLDILNVGPYKVRPNANLTYISAVVNFGPALAQGVAISNAIPAGTSYVSSALCTLQGGCSNTNCSFDGRTASCTVGDLPKYGLEFLVVTVKVTATAGSKITDTAKVTGFNPDPRTLDNTSTAVTYVVNKDE
jgi:uncharacterized repeat protein (TIGR01451 family)